MNYAHTPGPWHTDSLDQVRSARGIVIARLERRERHEYMDFQEQAANARLCAAAPELLATLNTALAYAAARFAGDQPVSGSDLVDWFAQWRQHARSVVARATLVRP